ncbi:flagellar hook-associated protein FlgK [Roseateles sp. BYS78W]|uniref:Flagellar hook-associated protein 1 n=1 Tax=Pelomonas candidula TaxID=3299025 RepID=A0ABW7HGD1_9BURK
MSLLLNALSGTQAAQAALTATSNNVANAATPGYTRQGVLLGAVQGPSAGAGVQVLALQRFSDGYKNLQLWQSNSVLGHAQVAQDYLTQLEQVMSDDTSNVNQGVQQLFAALNAASGQPDSVPLRQQVLSSANALSLRMGTLQNLLGRQQLAITTQQQAVVQQVNSLAQDVAQLNGKITAAHALGMDDSGLQDARDLKLDNLASLTGLQVVDQPDGSRNVSLPNGQPLVVGAKAGALSITAGQLSLTFANTHFEVPGAGLGGQLGGLSDAQAQVLSPLVTQMQELATHIANSVNGQLAAGYAPPAATPGQPLFALNNGQLQVTSLQAADLAFSGNPTDAGNSDNLGALIALQKAPMPMTLFNAAGQATGTTQIVMGDAFNQMVGSLGTASQQNQASIKTAQTVREQAQQNWNASAGVNNDEEATNLMQYQQLYQSNMKVAQVANTLFDAALQMLG